MADLEVSTRRKVLFGCILGAVVVLGLEGTARLLPIQKEPEPVVPAAVGQYSERLGWEPRPNAQGVSNRFGYPIDYRMNSLGLRDDETMLAKPSGTFRIVLLGDSRTFGFGVPVEKHFASILEGYFRNVEVINLGMNGYGVDQELLVLRHKGFQFEPDLVMAYVAHFGNHRHMYKHRFGKAKPKFELSDDGNLILTNVPVPRPLDQEYGWSVASSVRAWLYDHSRVYQIVRDSLKRLLASYEPQGAEAFSKDDEKNIENSQFRKELFRLGQAIIDHMSMESAQNGAQFVLITPMPELIEFARSRGIHVIDVKDSLDNTAYALPDGFLHINESGNGVLAWEIARYLRNEGLIPRPYLRQPGEKPIAAGAGKS